MQTLSEELGYTTDEINEIIKHKFLIERKYLTTSKDKDISLTYSKSTKGLTTKEFEDLMSKIRIWANSELGIWIQEPNEVLSE